MDLLNTYIHHICSYCGTLLKKYNSFREKCVSSQQLLMKLAEQNMLSAEKIKSTQSLPLPYTKKHIKHEDIFLCHVKTESEQNLVYYDNDVDFDPSQDVLENDNYKTIQDMSSLSANFNSDSEEEPLSKLATHMSSSHAVIMTKDVAEMPKDVADMPKDVAEMPKDVAEMENLEIKLENEGFDGNLTNYVNLDEDVEVIFLSKDDQLKEIEARKNTLNYINSLYKCDICYKGFKTMTTYKNHAYKHSPSAGSAICDVCHIRRPSLRLLRIHMFTTHERKYICKLCRCASRTAHGARLHREWHGGRRWRCACGAEFERSTSYLSHARLRHGPRPQTESNTNENACDKCGFNFKNEEALSAHVASMLNGSCHDSSGICNECGENFKDASELREHYKTHRKKNTTCPRCSRTFASEHSLSSHYERVHVERSREHSLAAHICEMCGHTCKSKSSLRNHQRTHTGEKPYGCGFCHKRFSAQQRLTIHVRTHTGESPFKCTDCPKAFKHKAALNRHMRVHTGAKPYSCPQCGKSFSQSNSMKQHCARVHMKQFKYVRKDNK